MHKDNDASFLSDIEETFPFLSNCSEYIVDGDLAYVIAKIPPSYPCYYVGGWLDDDIHLNFDNCTYYCPEGLEQESSCIAILNYKAKQIIRIFAIDDDVYFSFFSSYYHYILLRSVALGENLLLYTDSHIIWSIVSDSLFIEGRYLFFSENSGYSDIGRLVVDTKEMKYINIGFGNHTVDLPKDFHFVGDSIARYSENTISSISIQDFFDNNNEWHSKNVIKAVLKAPIHIHEMPEISLAHPGKYISAFALDDYYQRYNLSTTQWETPYLSSFIRDIKKNAGESFGWKHNIGEIDEIASIISSYLDVVFTDEIDVIMPIPPSKNRQYQPLIEISKLVGEKSGIYCDTDCVQKNTSIEVKTISNREERLKTLENSIIVNNNKDYNWKHILILEDHVHLGHTVNVVVDKIFDIIHPRKISVLAITHNNRDVKSLFTS